MKEFAISLLLTRAITVVAPTFFYVFFLLNRSVQLGTKWAALYAPAIVRCTYTPSIEPHYLQVVSVSLIESPRLHCRLQR